MIRFSHTVFALPFAMLSAILAWTVPPPDVYGVATTGGADPTQFRFRELVGILLSMVFARSSAMAFNRLVDQKLDAANPRTAGRHLATGSLTRNSVAVFLAISTVGFVASTALFLPNRLPLLLSLPVLLFIMAYSYTKRFTSLAHFWLGASLMLAPVCTWIALRGEILARDPLDILPATVLGAAVLLWVAGFDIIYACQDMEFDQIHGLRSVPARLGVSRALSIAAGCHAGMVLLLFALPWICPQLQLGGIYLVGIGAVGTLLIYEHQLVRPDDLSRVNAAFFHVNAVVSIGLLLVVALDLLVR